MLHQTIETLRRLRLTGMAKALEEQQGVPDRDRLSFDERLAMLVDREAVERHNAALAQRLRIARLRQAACLEDIDYRTVRGLDRGLIQGLASGRWLQEHSNVLVRGRQELDILCAWQPGRARRVLGALPAPAATVGRDRARPGRRHGRTAVRPARQDPAAHPR